MRDLRSELDAVPGIGPRRRKTLLTTFGSLAGVRRATREELVSTVGTKVADAVLVVLQSARIGLRPCGYGRPGGRAAGGGCAATSLPLLRRAELA